MPDISKRLDKAEKYLQKGKPEAALEEYLAALEEDPKNEVVRQTAADLCIAAGRNSEAATLLGYLFDEQRNDPTGIVTYKVYSDQECTKEVASAGAMEVSAGTVPASNPQTLAPGT